MKFELNSLIFIFLSIALFIGASYTLSGWQYLYSSLLLAFVVVGIILPFLSLRQIKISKQMQTKSFVGQKTNVEIRIENTSNKDKYFLNILDETILRVNIIPKSFILKSFLNKILFETLNYTDMYFIKKLSATETIRFNYTYIPKKRGIYNPGEVKVLTGFPFSIITKSFSYFSSKEITIYPKVIKLRSGWINRRAKIPTYNEISKIYTNTNIASMTRSLREYVPGDSIKHIHWPSSARANKLIVREFEIESKGHVVIVLDSSSTYRNSDYYELAVTTTASLLNVCHKDNLITRLITQYTSDNKTEAFADNWISQLELLARVQQVKSGSIENLIMNDMKRLSVNSPVYIVISSGSNKIKSIGGKNLIKISVAPNFDPYADYTITTENSLRSI